MEKLEITPIDANNHLLDGERIVVQFNPASYSVSKSVTWKPAKEFSFRDAPRLEFENSGSRTLKLELFFDVSEPPDPGNPGQFIDVRQLTGPLVALTRRSQGAQTQKNAMSWHPPIVRLDWGGAGPKNSDFPFIGVIDSLSQNFTMFSPEGRPLRATLSLGVTESSDPAQDKLVDIGDFELVAALDMKASLPGIAARYTGQPKDWRAIAEANRIEDPLKLPAGGLVKVPAVKPGSP